MTTEERGIHGHMLWDVDLETFIYLVGKKCTKAITKGLYIKDIKLDCWKKSILLGFYYCRYPGWLTFFLSWKLNRGQNKKLWGRGGGEKAMRTTTCNQSLEIHERPLSVLWKEELAYMWCDVLWSVTSAITQCKTNHRAK